MRLAKRLAPALLALCLSLLPATAALGVPAVAPSASGSSVTAGSRLAPPQHVVVIVFENKEYGQVIGSPDAPYINSLAKTYALATSSFAVTHPSEPNYLAMIGGDTFGIQDDGDHVVSAKNLVDSLEHAGKSWKGYMSSLPYPCYKGDSYIGPSGGVYAKKHDPFMTFSDIANSSSRCNRVVPYRDLLTDLANGRAPNFSFVVPNLCQDMHDCSVATGDQWLQSQLPRILSYLSGHDVVFITFDEGATDSGCCTYAAGGHIATLAVGPGAMTHFERTTPSDHYSLLKAIEIRWALPLLGKSACSCTKGLGDMLRP